MSAQRYRGPYSPGAGTASQAEPRTQYRHRYESRVKWITIAAAPFLLGAFWQGPVGMVSDLAAFGMVALGAWLTREGLAAEAAYDARRVARRPGWPRKMFGGVLTGLGLAVGAAAPGAITGALLIGFAGALLHYLAFGPDPMRDKGMEGIDPFQQDRVARVIAEGEGYLTAMQDAIRRTGDRRLEARVALFAETARELFRRVEEDPGDLTAARRYLGVYLMGARDATVKFADLYVHTRDESARAEYEGLLHDLGENFAARTRSLIEGGRTDFDIELQVLRERLAREGVRMPEPGPEGAPAIEDRRGVDLADLLRGTLNAGRRQD
ncbi:MAG: 5-bromo-4-chloroindolyl phosphate hydrolysis family protein [Paracoccus sp. (in: a-proteobacteria)]|nr:5-bromo-4-chloroindolyl phosphate hydrolysis family protein [Paracoccus sp. (in: a-proteobacteria)]